MNSTLQKIKIRQRYAISFVGLILLIIPKINIISLSSYEGAGIRVDDFILLFLLLIFLILNLWKGARLNTQEVYFFIFILVGGLSIILNFYFQRGSILYVLRLIEYWTFFYIGSFILLSKRLFDFLFILLILNALIIFLQYFGYIGGYANGVYQSILSRPSGLTNGAYEVPMVIALIFSFILGNSPKLNFKLILLYFLSNTLIVLTAARIPFVAINIIFIYFFLKHASIKVKLLFIAAVVPIFILLIWGNVFSGSTHESGKKQSFSTRIVEVISDDSITAIQLLVNMAPFERNGVSGHEMRKKQVTLKTGNVKWELTQEKGLTGDLSLLVRVNKWLWASKTFLNQDWIIYLFGLGPGSLGNALDGGLLRVLLENGIIGFICFMFFLYKRPKKNKFDPLLFMTVTFLLGNLFIDYYLSYKVMALFFLLYGATAQSFYTEKVR